jgi:hypothetical protein
MKETRLFTAIPVVVIVALALLTFTLFSSGTAFAAQHIANSQAIPQTYCSGGVELDTVFGRECFTHTTSGINVPLVTDAINHSGTSVLLSCTQAPYLRAVRAGQHISLPDEPNVTEVLFQS